MFLTDFHIHSTFSDGKMSVAEIVDFYGTKGFGAIAITDHLCEERTLLGRAAIYLNRTLTRESIDLYFETIRQEAARAWDQYRMRVLPGYEITKNSVRNHRTAHILVLGVESYIQADQDIIEIAEKVHDQEGLVIAAHPTSNGITSSEECYLWDRREELAEILDAWEITDTGRLIEAVTQSQLPKLATSDLHRPRQINSWKTLLDCPRERGSIFEAIKKQQLSFRYYEAPRLVCAPQTKLPALANAI